jgi:glycerophosphoryl diester phosphodiesterase
MKYLPFFYLATLILIMASCNTNKWIDIQGHRGSRGLMPENTIEAFNKAMDLSVTTLEMDVIISADNKVVVSHEPWLNSEITTLPNGKTITKEEERNYNLFKMNYDSIKNFDVGLKQHPRFLQQQKIAAYKPLLIDVINAAKQKSKEQGTALPLFNIEIKSTIGDSAFQPDNETFVKLVMKVIVDAAIEDKAIIQSFDYRNLEIMHKQYPKIKLAMLINENETPNFNAQLKKLSFKPQIMSPHFSLATAAFINDAHLAKCKVIPWTVNDITIAKNLAFLNVDGIITDYPNLINNRKLKD